MAAGVDRSPVASTARRIAAEDTTASAALERCLVAYDRDNAELNAITVLLADEARVEASQRDLVVAARKPLGPLHGVPVAIKEEIAVAGTVTTYGGLGNTTPATHDAEVVRRLRAAGAVIVGKTNMPEFGSVPYTESDAFGPTLNPWDPTRSPGGSSGGSAVAVATGMAAAAMGGDGGGSIRVPAACCGVFGLKPQRGRVTTAPEPHLWWALGAAGPLTRSVLDSALVYDAIRGGADTDLFHAGDVGSFAEAARREPGRLRIGWSTKPVTRGVKPHPDNVRAVEETARLLADLGHDVREIAPRYPDPSAAFLPQYFASIRSETDALEHPDRVSRRNAGANTLGFWVTPRVRDWAIRYGERVARKATADLRRGRRAADAGDGQPASHAAVHGGQGGRALDARLDPRRRVPRAVERRRQPGRLGAGRLRRRRSADSGPAGRAHRRRRAPPVALRAARGRAALALPEMTWPRADTGSWRRASVL